MTLEMEEMAEKTLASGEVITISPVYKGYGYDVDCWDKDGNNRWTKWFPILPEAMREYNRWN